MRPTPEWAKANPANVLVYHQRVGIEGCTCGWAEPGASFPEHQLDALAEAGWAVVDQTRACELELIPDGRYCAECTRLQDTFARDSAVLPEEHPFPGRRPPDLGLWQVLSPERAEQMRAAQAAQRVVEEAVANMPRFLDPPTFDGVVTMSPSVVEEVEAAATREVFERGWTSPWMTLSVEQARALGMMTEEERDAARTALWEQARPQRGGITYDPPPIIEGSLEP